MKIGTQRFSRKKNAVQRYVAHDFSYGFGQEKIDGFPVFRNYQFGTMWRHALSLSQIYGLRYNLTPEIVLNAETGFLFEVAYLSSGQRYQTQTSFKWRPITLSIGFKL